MRLVATACTFRRYDVGTFGKRRDPDAFRLAAKHYRLPDITGCQKLHAAEHYRALAAPPVNSGLLTLSSANAGDRVLAVALSLFWMHDLFSMSDLFSAVVSLVLAFFVLKVA